MTGPLLTEQEIQNAVAMSALNAPSSNQWFFAVSALNAITATTTPLSADSSRVSAVQGDAGLLHASAFVANSLSATAQNFVVSAVNADAGTFHVSGFSPDASLFRISAIGGTTGDHTLVDGTTQTISATLTPISAKPAGSVAGLVTNTFQQDASQFRISAFGTVSAFLNQGTVSAYSPDASLFRISAVNFPLNVSGSVSAFINQGTVSAYSPDAGLFRVSSFGGDAGQDRTSAIQGDAGLLHVSGFTATATNFPVSAVQSDAGLQHTSSFAGDANQMHTSSVQGDAGLQHVSALNQDANFMHVSAFSPDASLFKVSAAVEYDTISKGGTNTFATSAASSSPSAIKTTGDGRIYGWALGNPAGVNQYLNIYAASATSAVTVGTTVPLLQVFVPTLGGNNLAFTPGISSSNGIVVAVVSTAGGTAAGASGLQVALFYG